MINIEANADIINKGHGFYQMKVDLGFPGCDCPIRIETAMFWSLHPEDTVEKILRDADHQIRTHPTCPKCGKRWIDEMPFVLEHGYV